MDKRSKNIETKIRDFAKNHYENFPVSSFLIPKDYRKDIAIVYWFARTADDLADEGAISDAQRLNELSGFERSFNESFSGDTSNPYLIILKNVIDSRNIDRQLFIDLISAFKQDVMKKRYANRDEILDYCSRSANPVGRILLRIFNINDKNAIICSDKICTALQLANFYQDTIIDLKKNRIYYPADEMEMFKVTEKMFELRENNPNIKALVKHNVDKAKLLFNEGKDLLNYLSGRIKMEIKWTIMGGEMILNKIEKCDYEVLNYRPVLNKLDFLKLLVKSIF